MARLIIVAGRARAAVPPQRLNTERCLILFPSVLWQTIRYNNSAKTGRNDADRDIEKLSIRAICRRSAKTVVEGIDDVGNYHQGSARPHDAARQSPVISMRRELQAAREIRSFFLLIWQRDTTPRVVERARLFFDEFTR